MPWVLSQWLLSGRPFSQRVGVPLVPRCENCVLEIPLFKKGKQNAKMSGNRWTNPQNGSNMFWGQSWNRFTGTFALFLHGNIEIYLGMKHFTFSAFTCFLPGGRWLGKGWRLVREDVKHLPANHQRTTGQSPPTSSLGQDGRARYRVCRCHKGGWIWGGSWWTSCHY